MTELLDQIFQASGPIVAVIAPDGRILRASASFGRLTCAAPEGRKLQDFLDPATWQGRLPTPETRRLTLRDAQGGVETLDCTIAEVSEGLSLVGSVPFLVHSDLLESKARLENRLTSLNRQLQRKIRELERAQEEIKTLTGLLPICAYCKKIRNDGGYWESLERYVTTRVDVTFSHGICESCLEEHFPEYADDDEDDEI